MIRLYDYLPSGNGYKVRLLLTQMGVAFERVELDIVKGETRTTEFLTKFPNGRIPAVELDDGERLFESNAILWYFAEGTPFLPADRMERAQVVKWFCFEQYNLEPNIASRRYLLANPQLQDPRRAMMDRLLRLGQEALGVIDGHLASHQWMVGSRYSIADIALYAYTHVAHEGGYDLAPYPAIRAWLDRVRAQPRNIPITQG